MILIINLATQKLSRYEFVEPIVELTKSLGLQCDVKHFTEIDEIEKYERIILCGTALKDSDHLEHLDKFEWLKTCEKPVLGICAGFQTIAAVFGERIIKIREVGMTDIHIVKKTSLLDKDLTVFALHHLGVKPTNMEVLARSDRCVHAIKKGKIVGVLFHPEVRNSFVIENFLSN